MYLLFSILAIITGILLVLIVLIQNSKGGGLAANFAAGNQTFGVRQTADYLEKFTWGFAIALLIFCLSATMSMPKQNETKSSSIQKGIENVQNPATRSQFPVSPPQEQPQQQPEQQPQPQGQPVQQ